MKNKQEYSCPSAPPKKGNILLGSFEDGKRELQYSKGNTVIDAELLLQMKSEVKSNYRTAMPCLTKNCGNWNGQKCTVYDQMSSFLNYDYIEAVASCSVRDTCRWFDQEGYNACKLCPLIRTESFRDKIES